MTLLTHLTKNEENCLIFAEIASYLSQCADHTKVQFYKSEEDAPSSESSRDAE